MKSEAIVNGVQNAPHRALFNALGYTKEEMSRPLVGIVCSQNDIVPGHMELDRIAEAVKMGVGDGGRYAVRLPGPSQCATGLQWDIRE